MNKSTGLPVSGNVEHPLKQSFATTVSVLGNPGAAAVVKPKVQKVLRGSGKGFAAAGPNSTTLSPKAQRRVGSTYVGGATISQRMSQSISPAAKKAMLSARLSNGSYINKMELDENANVQLQTLKQDVFVDKRAP